MSEDQAYRTARLIAGYIRGTLTDAEKDELDDWITQTDANMELFAELTDEKNIQAALEERGSYNSEAAITRLKQKIAFEKPVARRGKTRLWYAVAAAAAAILVALLFLYPYQRNKQATEELLTSRPDLLPGTHKAILTIGDGRQIVLDSNAEGNLLQQGDLQVRDSGAVLTYHGSSAVEEWHTLTTPKGGEYQLKLPDGTRVWLNAESSIRFPNRFVSSERRVEISGEVYFEVEKDSRQFIATASSSQTEVLGTHFNIHAYPGDAVTAVTLAEGSIKVSDTISKRSLLLQPGQQAQVSGEALEFAGGVNLEEVLAWKSGWFYFEDEPIAGIMKKIARWYDVDIRYEGDIPYHFNAEIERNVPVSKLFALLEKTGRVHFEIKDDIILVKP
ncbi:MAG: FecR domain-containing protein [Chitinophagaceae bacterium]|nr:FecR domain-containing protein [Chitinophagaceae bacterium]MCW5925579.1 FecR domain-containing protein [Chitinophagaceae bacterium]